MQNMSQYEASPDRVQQAIAALRVNDKLAARRLIAEELRNNPHNENAWLVMAALVETEVQRRDCFERALAIDPDNPQARQALAQMGVPQPHEPEINAPDLEEAATADDASISELEDATADDNAPAPDLETAAADDALTSDQEIEDFVETETEPTDWDLEEDTTEETPGEQPKRIEWEPRSWPKAEEHPFLSSEEDERINTEAEAAAAEGPFLEAETHPLEEGLQENIHAENLAVLPKKGMGGRLALVCFAVLVGVVLLAGGVYWANLNWVSQTSGLIQGDLVQILALPVGAAVLGLILIIIMAVVLFRTLDSMQTPAELSQHGRNIQGAVIRKGKGKDGRYWVICQFALHPRSGGEEIFQIRQAVDEETFNRLDEGSAVTIRYLSRDPRISRMEV